MTTTHPTDLAIIQAMSDRLAAVEASNVKLQAQVLELERAIAALKTQPKPTVNDAFRDRVKTVTITIKREGESLWYRVNEQNPDTHHPIDSTQLLGRFVDMKVVPSEYDGEVSNVAVLSVYNRDTHTIYRIRMGAKLGPKQSVPLKFFMDSLSHVPDAALQGDLIFEVSTGKKAQTVCVKVVNPVTGRDFAPSIADLPEEERERRREETRQRWNDQAVQLMCLEQTMQRLNEIGKLGDVPTSATARTGEEPKPKTTLPTPKPVSAPIPKTTAAPSPAPATLSTPPPADPAIIQLNGTLMDLTPLQTQSRPNHPDGDRKFVKFTLSVGQTNHQCFAWDAIANRINVLFRNFDRVQAAGVWRQKNNAYFLEVQDIAADEAPMDLSNLIAISQIEADRVGLAKSDQDRLIQQRYNKNRGTLEAAELQDWITYLRGGDSTEPDAISTEDE